MFPSPSCSRRHPKSASIEDFLLLSFQNHESRDDPTWFKLIDYMEKMWSILGWLFNSGHSRCLVTPGSAIPSLNLILAWLPLQNGMLLEAPHRQSVTRFRTS